MPCFDLLANDLSHHLLDQVFPDFILAFAFAGGTTSAASLQFHPLFITILQVVSPEQGMLINYLEFLCNIPVKFMDLADMERISLKLIEVENDQIFLDLPFAESSVSVIVDYHEGVVCVKVQIQGVFLNLTLIGPDHVVTVVLSCASLCGKATQQEDN